MRATATQMPIGGGAPVVMDDQIPWAVRRIILLLTLISVLNFVDRQIINILAEAIKRDLALSDTHIGILTGMAFAFFYAALSLPAARLADRYHRPRVLGAAVVVWSAFTVLCGMAQNFVQLALARMGVGVGESACTPTAHSLISDYVPLNKRASAIALYQLGVPIGSMVGMAVGGIVADNYGWRAALLLVGLPGLAIGILVALIAPEPRRDKGEGESAGAAAAANGPLSSFAKFIALLASRRSARMMLPAYGLSSMVQYGGYAFVASFFLRTHNQELVQWAGSISAFLGLPFGPVSMIGILYGVCSGVMAGIGLWLGGRIADAGGEKSMTVMLTLPAWAHLAAAPFTIGTLFAPSLLPAIICTSFHAFLTGLSAPAYFASILGLVDARNRATVTAVFLIVSTFVGLGLGPLLIGLLSDYFNHGLGFGSMDGLRYSLTALAALAIPSSALLFLSRQDYAREFVR